MNCDERARAEVERPAVALCRYCSVGLCEEHLVELRTPAGKPLYACSHQPDRGLDRLTAGSKSSRSPAPHRAA